MPRLFLCLWLRQSGLEVKFGGQELGGDISCPGTVLTRLGESVDYKAGAVTWLLQSLAIVWERSSQLRRSDRASGEVEAGAQGARCPLKGATALNRGHSRCGHGAWLPRGLCRAAP